MTPVLLLTALLAQTGAPTATGATTLPVLTFEQAIREAHQNNLDLKALEARLDQADEISAKAWAGYLPTVTLGGSYTRNDIESVLQLPTGYWLRDLTPAQAGALNLTNGPASNPNTGDPSGTFILPSGMSDITIQKQYQWALQGTATQPLIIPPLWAGIAAAYSARKSAKLSIDNAQREVLFAVAQMYYGAVSLKQSVDVQKRLLEATQAHERDAKTRVDAGAMPQIALIRAQIDRAAAEQNLLRQQNAYAGAKIALGTLLGRDSDYDLAEPPDRDVDVNPESLTKAALNDRPDVLSARAASDAASGQRTASWLGYLPSLVAQGNYRKTNIVGFTGRDYAWSVALLASWTILDGGLREANLREAGAKLVEARANERNAEAKAVDDVKRTLLDLESARANSIKAAEQLRLARENMRLVEVNYNAGVGTQLDVTDATSQLAQAELGALAERLNAQIAVLRLLKAVGAYNP